jgi:hypothetical protein
MKSLTLLVCLALILGSLTGCAGTSADTATGSSSSSPYIPPATNPDNPPVTMGGYMDTSVTTQTR